MSGKLKQASFMAARGSHIGLSNMRQPSFLRPEHPFRLILFGGKGGVGKTTCAAASALAMANSDPGIRLLLVSTDPAHSLLDSLAGNAPPPNLHVLELQTDEYLERFRAEHGEKLEELAKRGTFLDEEDIKRFLSLSMPGLDELLAFLEIARWADEDDRYDRIIVDTAPTGHTLRLLSIPQLLARWLQALEALLSKHRYMKSLFSGAYQSDELDDFLGSLAESVQRTESLLQNRARCRFVPVMIAEELSVRETEDFLKQLKRSRIPVKEIIVNRIFPENACPVCSAERTRQLSALAGLPAGSSRLQLWGVPLYAHEVRGLMELSSFWKGAARLDLPPVSSSGEHIWATRSEHPRHLSYLVENPPPLPSASMQMIIFAGKGGVGKTTLASATALRLAREAPGREILIFSTDPAHSLADCLDIPIGSQPVRIMPGLTALEIDAEAEFQALKKQYHKDLKRFLSSFSESIDFTFDREVMERMMDMSPPGLDEIMALNVAMGFMAEGRYDTFVLDSAPTGHLIRLLELPHLVDQWIKAFFELFLKYKSVFRLPGFSEKLVKMSKDLKRFRSMLGDIDRSALYGVTILTGMALEETSDLVSACRRMDLNVPVLFLNLAAPPGPCPLCSALREREERLKESYRMVLGGLHQSLVYRQEEPRGVERLGLLGDALYRS